MTTTRIPVAIIGARALTAGELIRHLLRHPGVEIVALQARGDEQRIIGDVFGFLRGAKLPEITPIDPAGLPAGTRAAFLTLPHTLGAQHAQALLDRGVRVFDLSADFRFHDHRVYESVYGVAHPSPELNARAVYGLPELYREKLVNADLVACPGCYPTSVLLGLAPVLKAGLVEPDSIIADCKSGVSGAGRQPTDTTHYMNANESIAAYKVASHRHQPEIEEHLSNLAGGACTLTFVPHLTPMDRGILATTYATLKEPHTAEALHALYEEYYRDEPFVRVLPREVLPATKNMVGSNFCDVQVRVDTRTRRLIAVSAIDNLLKGASGQALQAFNVSFGLPETAGLV